MEGSINKTKGTNCAALEREDFDAGPTNLDCIESGLWIGKLFVMQLSEMYS